MELYLNMKRVSIIRLVHHQTILDSSDRELHLHLMVLRANLGTKLITKYDVSTDQIIFISGLTGNEISFNDYGFQMCLF